MATEYGVLSTGFSRKPLTTILAEIEAANITEFGPGLVQTAQSPMGQINGLVADLVTSLWELAEDVYQSYDPDQAEGNRLDTLGSIRLINRQAGEGDESYRLAVTNQGQARVDLQDLARSVAAIDGVTYYHIWVNDGTTIDENGLPPATVCIALTGGDGDDVAVSIRQFLVPGIALYGNTIVESSIDGFCRSFRVLRPIEIDVALTVNVNKFRDNMGCPPPSDQTIRDYLLANLVLLNGDDVTFYRVRSIIESGFTNVEVLSISGLREDEDVPAPQVFVGFNERAILDVTVVSA